MESVNDGAFHAVSKIISTPMTQSQKKKTKKEVVERETENVKGKDFDILATPRLSFRNGFFLFLFSLVNVFNSEKSSFKKLTGTTNSVKVSKSMRKVLIN